MRSTSGRSTRSRNMRAYVRQRLDVPPLPLREERVEGQRRLAGAGDAGDDGEPIVRNLEGDVLEVVLAGSLDPEPRGLGHSAGPPEMGSLLEVLSSRQMANAIHVLVVDDDADVRGLLSAVLERDAGARVTEAASGAEGDGAARPRGVRRRRRRRPAARPQSGLDVLRWARAAEIDTEFDRPHRPRRRRDGRGGDAARRLRLHSPSRARTPSCVEVVAKAAEKKALRRENSALKEVINRRDGHARRSWGRARRSARCWP